MARKKAKVVIVGAVPTGFSRTNYYKKELDLRMSSSYGPGRSDIQYEEKGVDYPVGYVRWTENRNMQSFIDLLASKRLNIEPLISHTFPLTEAPDAYNMILSRNESFSGVVIQYDNTKEPERSVKLSEKVVNPVDANVGFIGAGSFAQGFLLPNIKGHCNFIGVATNRGNTSRYVADKYGFAYCAEKADDIIADSKINTVFVVTRHNLHAEFVKKAVESGKHVFVEKPLAMTEAELQEIREAYTKEENIASKHLMVGFNRRFAPAVKETKKLFLPEQKKSIVIRVNSGIMPPEHWVNDPEIGGGRIVGEACHFIDLAMFLAESPIVSVAAEAMQDANGLDNTVVVNLKMENGSVASVNYFANGNKSASKEYIEVFCGGTIARINDFRSLTIYGKRKKTIKYKGQDKGHASEVKEFLSSVVKGEKCPIPFKESYLSTLATFKVLRSIAENRKIFLDA
jgi:predicted dehydrogenase